MSGLALDETIRRGVPGSNARVRFGDPVHVPSTITPIWNNGGIAVALAGTGPDYSTWLHTRSRQASGVRSSRSGRPSVGLGQLDFVLDIHLRPTPSSSTERRRWDKSQTTPGLSPPPISAPRDQYRTRRGAGLLCMSGAPKWEEAWVERTGSAGSTS